MQESFERHTVYFLLLSVFVSAFYFSLALNFKTCYHIFRFIFAVWIIEFIRWTYCYLNYRIKNYENEN